MKSHRFTNSPVVSKCVKQARSTTLRCSTSPEKNVEIAILFTKSNDVSQDKLYKILIFFIILIISLPLKEFLNLRKICDNYY